VAEELLDVADAGVSLKEMSRVGVAQRVREDRTLESCGLRVVGAENRKKAPVHAQAVLREEERELSR
jgi:hypothetical protein